MPITVYGEVNPDHARFLVPRDALLWRYMDIGKYLDLITTSRLWFTRVSEFQKIDPYEAALTKYDEDKTTKIVEAKSNEELKEILMQYGETGISNLLEQFPDKSMYFFQLLYLSRLPHVHLNAYTHSVSCWHENPTESDAMWALYAGRDAGIAIKITVTRVLEAFGSAERTMSIAKVTYDSLGHLSVLSAGIFDSLLVKRHAFHHENEVRIIALTMDGYESPDWTKNNQIYNVDASKPVVPGVYIDCNIRYLIEEVGWPASVTPFVTHYNYRTILEPEGEALLDLQEEIRTPDPPEVWCSS